VNLFLTSFIERIKEKSLQRFFVSVFFLVVLRVVEFVIDFLKGDGDGSMTSPIGLLLNAVYLVLICFAAYNFSASVKFFNNKKTIIALISINVMLSFTALKKGHDWGDDFSLYIAQAKVICEGGFEQLKNEQLFTQTNSGYLLGPDFYPWGFPALIAPVYKFFGFNFTALKIAMFAWFPLLLWLLYATFKMELEEKTSLFIALFAFSPVIFSYRDAIMGDIPFMFFSVLGALMIRRIVSLRRVFVNEQFSYVLLGVIIFMAYSIKTAGIVLLPVLLATQVLEGFVHGEGKKIISLKNLLPYFLFAIFFFIYSKITGYSDASYAKHLDWTNLYYHLHFNFFYYLNLPSEFFNAPVLSNFSSLFWGICFIFMVFGLADLKRRDISLLFYVIFMLSILLIAPYQAGLRYIFPVLPVIVYFIIKGISSFEKLISEQNISGILLFPVLVFFAYGIMLNSADVFLHRDRILEGAFDTEGKELMDFVKSNTKPDEVIIFYKPRLLRFLTGRNSFVVKTKPEITDGRANYIIIHRNARNDLFPLNEEISTLFNREALVFENSDFFVYRIKHD